MLGWMILFGLMIMLGLIVASTGAPLFSTLVVLTFGLLFLIGLVARFVGGRAW